MRKFLSMVALCAVLFTGCTSGNENGDNTDKSSKESYKIHLFEKNEYLAEVWWGDDYDEQVALNRLHDKYNSRPAASVDGGGCSSWRKENFHGRNIDWNMRDYATIIIHMPKNEAKGVKYASVGLIAGNPTCVKSFIHENGEIPEEYRSWLPATIVDGINECGVVINHNIVPFDGCAYQETGELVTMILCRYVLDHFATAKEAVDALRSTSVAQILVKVAHDYSHFMISDPTESYVVEWINGEFVATEFVNDGNGNYFSDGGQPAIMTNYFVGEAEKYGLGTQEFFRNHIQAAGVERTWSIQSQLGAAGSVEDHLNICRSVMFSKFCKGETDWATENCGNYGYDEQSGKAFWFPVGEPNDIHWMEDGDIYGAAKALLASPSLADYYRNFIENWNKCDPENEYWYTQHSVVYDLKEKKGYLIMQEGMSDPDPMEITVE